MDTEVSHRDEDEDLEGEEDDDNLNPMRKLPHDLPKSLDDRQPIRSYGAETEMYDAWQGRNQFAIPFHMNYN